MEADLSRFHHIDYRDRWRTLPDGSRALTLRMIAVRVEHLPPESAVATAARGGEAHWTLTDVLVAHLWQAVTRSKKPHPMLARAAKHERRRRPMDPKKLERFNEARKRARARRRAVEAGEVT